VGTQGDDGHFLTRTLTLALAIQNQEDISVRCLGPQLWILSWQAELRLTSQLRLKNLSSTRRRGTLGFLCMCGDDD
jgi:hypothetical protein